MAIFPPYHPCPLILPLIYTDKRTLGDRPLNLSAIMSTRISSQPSSEILPHPNGLCFSPIVQTPRTGAMLPAFPSPFILLCPPSRGFCPISHRNCFVRIYRAPNCSTSGLSVPISLAFLFCLLIILSWKHATSLGFHANTGSRCCFHLFLITFLPL